MINYLEHPSQEKQQDGAHFALSDEIDQLTILDQIQKRALWLSMQIIHQANKVRPNPDGSKVGGHQDLYLIHI